MEQAEERKGLSIYISADMEGVAGVVSAAQCSSDGAEYARYSPPPKHSSEKQNRLALA